MTFYFFKYLFWCSPFGYLYFRFFFYVMATIIPYVHPVYGDRVLTHDFMVMSRLPKMTCYLFFVLEDVIFLNPCQAPEVLVGRERPTLFSDIW